MCNQPHGEAVFCGVRMFTVITITYHKEIGINTRNWIDAAQDRDYWRALVNAALKLRVL